MFQAQSLAIPVCCLATLTGKLPSPHRTWCSDSPLQSSEGESARLPSSESDSHTSPSTAGFLADLSPFGSKTKGWVVQLRHLLGISDEISFLGSLENYSQFWLSSFSFLVLAPPLIPPSALQVHKKTEPLVEPLEPCIWFHWPSPSVFWLTGSWTNPYIINVFVLHIPLHLSVLMWL